MVLKKIFLEFKYVCICYICLKNVKNSCQEFQEFMHTVSKVRHKTHYLIKLVQHFKNIIDVYV